jgi:acyl-CoA reductase-like NAD-dependent aldehyde dehydrogenase
VFVEDAAYDAFVAAMGRAVSALTVGVGDEPRTDVGPLIHAAARDQISAQLEDAVAKGARVVATAKAPETTTGPFFPPTLLADVTDEMRVLREETFGPLLPVVRVKDADEAIRRANASSFGLSASVWTRDRARGAAVARQLDAGAILINDAVSVVGMPDVPYGGVKHSGLGRLHGTDGLAACVRSTAIVDDRFATWHQPWWFRYGAAHRAGFEAFGRLTHGASLTERLSGDQWRDQDGVSTKGDGVSIADRGRNTDG